MLQTRWLRHSTNLDGATDARKRMLQQGFAQRAKLDSITDGTCNDTDADLPARRRPSPRCRPRHTTCPVRSADPSPTDPKPRLSRRSGVLRGLAPAVRLYSPRSRRPGSHDTVWIWERVCKTAGSEEFFFNSSLTFELFYSQVHRTSGKRTRAKQTAHKLRAIERGGRQTKIYPDKT